MGTVRFNEQRRKWQIDFVSASGERIRQLIAPGAEGKRLARQILRQREAEAQLGVHHLPASRTMRFDEYSAEWLERMRPPWVRPSTWGSYEDAVERLLPFFGEKRLGAITREDVQAYLVSGHLARRHHAKQRKAPQPLSVTTLNYGLSMLRFILNDAIDGGHIANSRAVRVKPLKKEPRPEGHVQYLTPEQMDRLFAAAEEPYRTMYRLTIDAGLRRGEALALRWRDVDITRRCVFIRQSRVRERDGDRYVVRDVAPKTKGSTTVIEELSPSVVQALLALPAGDDPTADYVFRNRKQNPIDPDDLDRVFQRHLKQAGLVHVGLHALRHTCATLMIAAGEHPKAVQVRMRHQSIQTTMDTYGHLLPGAFQGMGERLEAFLNGNRTATKHVEEPTIAAGPAKSLDRY